MKQFFQAAVTIAMCMFALAACSKIEDDSIEPANEVCKMIFNGKIAGYDSTILRDGSATRAASSWQNGDKVYIAFYKGADVVAGIAQYSDTDGWGITFEGDLAEGSGMKCEVRFFVNSTFANDYNVNLNPHSEIYEDVNGTYDYSGGTLCVTASLVPKVGRIRFTGNAGDVIYLTGIETYSRYAPETNTFYSTKGMFSETVTNNGSTEYIYGVCSYKDRKVGIVGSDYAFTKYFSESIYRQGESGYMVIPTSSAHNGWKSGLFVTAGDVEFKMIPVHGYEGGLFLIGETEVTNAMYNMKASVSQPDIPYSAYLNGTWLNYITKLKAETNLAFYIPTKEEWQFAAKGGRLSQGYSYSGSNNPEDVAWYYGNAGGSAHPVKQLAPNELGIFDMSGNAQEYISNGNLCGGYYGSNENEIKISSYTGNGYYMGLRLALKCE